MTGLRTPLIDEQCVPITAKKQQYLLNVTDTDQLDIRIVADRGIIPTSTSAWAPRCVAIISKHGILRACQQYRGLKSCMANNSGGLGRTQNILQQVSRNSWFAFMLIYVSCRGSSSFRSSKRISITRHSMMRSRSCGNMCRVTSA